MLILKDAMIVKKDLFNPLSSLQKLIEKNVIILMLQNFLKNYNF